MGTVLLARRKFLCDSALVIGASLTGTSARAVAPSVRPEWSEFKTGTHLTALKNAIKKMKANTNAADPGSWSYWVNIHLANCPHTAPYFLAWHRGYLYHFEKRLRTVSGDAQLVLPYWNYYDYPTLPAEFTDPSASNPLYVQRENTNVRQALDLSPFGSSVLNFPRGASQAFEAILEDAPHNPIHNIIGGVMADMQSPIDPIFWLHHANIDRLWAAWTAAGGGRAMPATSASYWTGNFSYASNLTLARTLTCNNRTSLSYYYSNESMPTALPRPAERTDRVVRVVSAPPAPPLLIETAEFAISPARSVNAATFAVVGANLVGLADQSIDVPIPVPSEHQMALARIARGLPSATLGRSERFKSIRLTFDKVAATKNGLAGGYFYNIWVTVPGAPEASPGVPVRVKVGTLGPFQISAANHHNMGRISYSITDLLSQFSPTEFATLTVLFERVSGDNSPTGVVVKIGEARLEITNEQ